MKLAICIEKSGGVLFGGRRVSQDRVLREKLLSLVGDNAALIMTPYSAKQFEEMDAIVCDENPLCIAKENDICFLENTLESFDNISTVYLFQWNRAYPADTFLEFIPQDLGYKKTSSENFEGSSHPKITLTVYERK